MRHGEPTPPIAGRSLQRKTRSRIAQSAKCEINHNRERFCSLSGSRFRPWTMSETASALFYIAYFRQV